MAKFKQEDSSVQQAAWLFNPKESRAAQSVKMSKAAKQGSTETVKLDNSVDPQLSMQLVELVARFLDESGYPKTYKRFKVEAEGKNSSPSWQKAVNGPFDTGRPSLSQVVGEWSTQKALKEGSVETQSKKSAAKSGQKDGHAVNGSEQTSFNDSDSSSGSDSDSTIAEPQKKAREPVIKLPPTRPVKVDEKGAKALQSVVKEGKTGLVKAEEQRAKVLQSAGKEQKVGLVKANEKAPKTLQSAVKGRNTVVGKVEDKGAKALQSAVKEQKTGDGKVDDKGAKALQSVVKEQKVGHVKADDKTLKAAPCVSVEKKAGKANGTQVSSFDSDSDSSSDEEPPTRKVISMKKETEALPPQVPSVKPWSTVDTKRKDPLSSSTSSSDSDSSSSDEVDAPSAKSKAVRKGDQPNKAARVMVDVKGPMQAVIKPGKKIGGPLPPTNDSTLSKKSLPAPTKTVTVTSTNGRASTLFDSTISSSGSSSSDSSSDSDDAVSRPIKHTTTSKTQQAVIPTINQKRKRSASPASRNPSMGGGESTKSKKPRHANTTESTATGNTTGNTATITHAPSNINSAKSQDFKTSSSSSSSKKNNNNNNNNTPFQRIPSNLSIDDRFKSNAYQSYDYAERAHRDLAPTRGKQFTKEKNKKKRGSYRGGVIDTQGGRGIKFD